jgi:cytochrome c
MLLVRGVLAALILGLSSAVASAQGNVENGEKGVYPKCRACHLVGEGAKNTVGPQLNGIIGKPAGMVPNYNYSENMKELGAKGLIWNDENLHKYLENPKSVVPQGKMAFPGLKEKGDRDDVIAFLKTFSK